MFLESRNSERRVYPALATRRDRPLGQSPQPWLRKRGVLVAPRPGRVQATQSKYACGTTQNTPGGGLCLFLLILGAGFADLRGVNAAPPQASAAFAAATTNADATPQITGAPHYD